MSPFYLCVWPGRQDGTQLRNRRAGIPVQETTALHKRAGWESLPLSPSATWEALAFWGSNFFLCSPHSACVWLETCLNEERQENMGLEEEIKQPKTNHFLEFRCLWNFKRNNKRHVFRSWSFLSFLGLLHFPQDPPLADPSLPPPSKFTWSHLVWLGQTGDKTQYELGVI